MRLTRETEYALMGLLFLSRKHPVDGAMLREIADAWGLPEKFLAKIFQKLTRAGILVSQRGVQGGFKLARPANEINLNHVIEAVEGPMLINWCLIDENACCQFHLCGLQAVLSKAQERIRDVFKEATLADMSEGTVLHEIQTVNFQNLQPVKTRQEELAPQSVA